MITLHKEATTIREELFKHIEDVQEDYIAKGLLPKRINLNKGIIRGLLEIWIWGTYQLYQFLDHIMKQAVPKSATGKWLDLHASSVDIKRLPATKAVGNVAFYRATQGNNIKIPKGKIVRTPADTNGTHYRFITTAEVTLTVGKEYINVPVIAEEYGMKSNSTAGMISEIVTPIQYIARVTNGADWLTSEGVDKEADTQLFERYSLQWRSQAGVTSAAYQLAALNVIGVQSVKVFDQHPRGQGTIDIVVLGSGGKPTDELVLKVEKAVADTIIINDNVQVHKVNILPIELSLTIEYMNGNVDDIKSKSEAFIRDRISKISSNIGEDLILSRVIADVMDIKGVKRVVWSQPATDVEVGDDKIVQLDNLQITMQEVFND